jgi:hypothetical protein
MLVLHFLENLKYIMHGSFKIFLEISKDIF